MKISAVTGIISVTAIFLRCIMADRKLEKYIEIERSIIKKYRKAIWSNFIAAVQEYDLIQENDKILIKDKNDKYRNLIAHTYDWVAAERLGKDIGLINNYEDLEAILTKNPNFVKVPQNTQNLTPYRSCIDSKYPFPNWQSAGAKEDKFFRRFLETAKTIYSLYTLACQREHIRPYGSQ